MFAEDEFLFRRARLADPNVWILRYRLRDPIADRPALVSGCCRLGRPCATSCPLPRRGTFQLCRPIAATLRLRLSGNSAWSTSAHVRSDGSHRVACCPSIAANEGQLAKCSSRITTTTGGLPVCRTVRGACNVHQNQRGNRTQSLRSYDLLSDGGVVTTCPSFTGSFGPGLKDVRTTPSLPSRRYVTL